MSSENTKNPFYNSNKFIGFFICLSFVIFSFVNFLYAIYYLVIIFCTIAILIILDITRKNQTKKIPLRITLLLLTIITWFLILDYRIVLIVFLLFVFLSALKSKPNVKLNKLVIPISICCLILLSFSLSDNRAVINKKGFIMENEYYLTEFGHYGKRTGDSFIPYDGYDTSKDSTLFRSLTFIGLRTDMDMNDIWANYDQANLSISAWFNMTTITSNVSFWKTNVSIYLISYDNNVKTDVENNNIVGYALLDRLISYGSYSEHYFTEHNETSVHIDADYIHQGAYLLVIDALLPPTQANKFLYTDFAFPTIEAPIYYSINNKMNYGTVIDTAGYSYVINYLNPRTEAENLFNDLIGNDIWNMIILFIILFSLSLFIALIARNAKIITVVNLLLICVAMIGLFAVISTGMHQVPQWLINIMDKSNATYLWGIIEAVKYLLVMGTVMGIILIISTYVQTDFEIIMQQTSQ